MKTNQTQSGKAFEFQLALALSKYLNISFLDNGEKKVGEACFLSHSLQEQHKIERAADEAITFLLGFEKRYHEGVAVYLQPDMAGKHGDPRDVIVKMQDNRDIGISSKNRHYAIKHSRLSDSIDFGKEWTDFPCSAAYMKRIKPVFDDLREKRKEKMLFRDIPDKVNRYYLPILNAFEDELRNLCETYGQRFVIRMFQYLLGKHDFYKVIKENGHVIIQSFNLNGDLAWGKKWKIPERIENIQRKRGSDNTLIVSFVDGWQISFRIHNASSRVEPSLKFDINFISMHHSVPKQEITYKWDKII
jgi:hypothetical protein